MMELKFALKSKERKALVNAISEILEVEAVYLKAPTYSFEIGSYNVDRDGTLTGEFNQDLIDSLVEQGFVAEEKTIEVDEVDRITIEFPVDGFNPEKLDNLAKMVQSRESLIKKALEVDELPIQILEDRIAFPWFPANSDGETVNAYAQFISALCITAKKKTRVVAKPYESFDNEAFAMRTFCNSLGLLGSEYGLCRKLMRKNLSGNSGYRFGSAENSGSQQRRDGVHREVLSIRLRPETIEKLAELAAGHEGNISRNMLIESILEEYVQGVYTNDHTLDDDGE